MNAASLFADIPRGRHIQWQPRFWRFYCPECDTALELDRDLVKEMAVRNIMPILQHVIQFIAKPWLIEHDECGGESVVVE